MADTNNKPKPTLNGEPVTQEQLREEKEKLPNNERIVEVADKPNEFRKVHRIQG